MFVRCFAHFVKFLGSSKQNKKKFIFEIKFFFRKRKQVVLYLVHHGVLILYSKYEICPFCYFL